MTLESGKPEIILIRSTIDAKGHSAAGMQVKFVCPKRDPTLSSPMESSISGGPSPRRIEKDGKENLILNPFAFGIS